MLDETRPNTNSPDTLQDTFYKLVTLSFIMILRLQSFSQLPTHMTDFQSKPIELIFILGFPCNPAQAREWARLTL